MHVLIIPITDASVLLTGDSLKWELVASALASAVLPPVQGNLLFTFFFFKFQFVLYNTLHLRNMITANYHLENWVFLLD